MDTNAPTPIASPVPPQPQFSPEADASVIKMNDGYGQMPKKYIRTFAGDMETLQSGGTPDLQPLGESRLAPEAPSPTPAPSAPPLSTSIPASNIGHVSMSPLSIPISKIESAAPTTPPVQESVPSEPPAIPVVAPVGPAPLETYASDFRDQVKESHASLATILATEQDAAPIVPESAHLSSRGSIFYISAGAALLVVGGVGAYLAYMNYSASLAPVLFAPTISLPIFVDERAQVAGVSTVLLQAVEQSVSNPLASGDVRLLYTADATTTDKSVFSELQLPAPNILLRNVNAANSMAGIVNAGDSQSPFFILSVLSYSNTFSGMLSWEPTMAGDLKGLFPPLAMASTTATTTTVGFRDEVINNHDVRIYRDAEKRSIILYGYWNQKTLIIARSPAAFTEIINRLATSHAQQ